MCLVHLSLPPDVWLFRCVTERSYHVGHLDVEQTVGVFILVDVGQSSGICFVLGQRTDAANVMVMKYSLEIRWRRDFFSLMNKLIPGKWENSKNTFLNVCKTVIFFLIFVGFFLSIFLTDLTRQNNDLWFELITLFRRLQLQSICIYELL